MTKDDVEKEIAQRFYDTYCELILRHKNGDSLGIAEWTQKINTIRDEWFQFIRKTEVLVTSLIIETQLKINELTEWEGNKMFEAKLRECEFCASKTPQGLCDIKIAGNFDADFDKCTIDRMKGLCENFGDKRLPLKVRVKMKWNWKTMQYEEM